jgi:hypothetical protein
MIEPGICLYKQQTAKNVVPNLARGRRSTAYGLSRCDVRTVAKHSYRGGIEVMHSKCYLTC